MRGILGRLGREIWRALPRVLSVAALTCLVIGFLLWRDYASAPGEPLRNHVMAFVAGGLYFGLLPGLALGVVWAVALRLWRGG